MSAVRPPRSASTAVSAGRRFDVAPSPPATVYHVGPWRYLWVPPVFGPLAAGCAVLAMAAKPQERAALWAGAGLLLLLLAFILALVRAARLEITPRGVALKQIGCRLEAEWSDVIAVRLERGREGFVLGAPLRGKDADRLAGAAEAALYVGFASYDTKQQELLDAHRLIPIEAFAWHLRHGGLRLEIERFAPHLAVDLATLDRPRAVPPAGAARATRDIDRSRLASIVGLSLLGVAAGIWVGPRPFDHFATWAYALVDPFYAIACAGGAWHLLRRRSWLLGGLMVVMTLVALAWVLVDWARVATLIGA